MSAPLELATRRTLREVPIPEGVKIYYETEDRKGDPIPHFGLEKMLEGDIGKNDPEEGTLLRFGPGRFRIGVARTALSAQEINEVGGLALDLMEADYFKKSAREEVDLIERLKLDLPAPLEISGRVLRSELEDTLGDLGALASRLRNSHVEREARYDAVIDKLAGLNVLYVDNGLMSGTDIKAELRGRARDERERAASKA